jgi:AAA15 family ATPase/GTPase
MNRAKEASGRQSNAPPTSGDLPDGLPKLRFLHRLGEETVPLAEDDESAGTIAYLRILSSAIPALSDGAVLCIDELDASLHPLLASQIVRLFNDPSTNKKGAQLIFSTHDTTLLSRANLRRDQIWFTEKSKDGSSHLYPLTDFKPRQNENLESGYLQGRYGAIPFLNPRAFMTQLERPDGKA